MSHTPGPWKATWHMIIASGAAGVSKAIGSAYGEGVNGDEQTANARLMAAAPDLLAACKDAVIVFTSPTMNGDDVEAIYQELLAAIAKAEAVECSTLA